MDNPVLLDALHNLSLQQLRAIIWKEVGEDRKYNSYTRDMLMNTIRNLCAGTHPQAKRTPSSAQPTARRGTRSSEGSAGEARNPTNPSIPSNPSHPASANPNNAACANRACRAPLQGQDGFCKRCSCSLCKKYDDNKDPSLWLVCGDTGTSSSANGCELSCHLQCALSNGCVKDTTYHCSNCGFKTCLLGASKRQLLHAKEARRVNELYERLDLAKRLLHNSQKTPPCTEYVEQALAKLQEDVGPQGAISGRGLVTRLSCGPKILDFISRSLKCFGTDDPVEELRLTHEIQFISIGSTYFLLCVIDRTPGVSSIHGYKIFHRRARGSYRVGPTVSIQRTQKAKITELKPGTTYMVRAVAFSEQGDEYSCEAKCVTKAEDYDDWMLERQVQADRIEENDEGNKQSESGANNDPALMDVVQQIEGVAEVEKNVLDSTQSETEETHVEEPNSMVPYATLDPSQLVNDTGTKDNQPGINDSSLKNEQPSNNSENTSIPNEAADDAEHANKATGLIVEDLNTPNHATPVNVSDVQTTNNMSSLNADPAIKPNFDINIPPSNSPQEAPIEEETSPPPLSAVNSASPTAHKNRPSTSPKGASGDANKMPDSAKQHKTTAKRPRGSKTAPVNELEAVNNGLSLLLGGPAGIITPRPTANPALSRPNALQDLQAIAGKPPTRKRTADEAFPTKKWSERIFEYCTRIIRYLESLGHIKPDFRMHFFTWLSTTATEQEKIAVNVYIQSLKDDPPGLAAQLIDLFTDVIESSRFNIDYDWR